jgi:hypothetical protein
VQEFAGAFCGAANEEKPKKEGFFSNLFRRGEG